MAGLTPTDFEIKLLRELNGQPQEGMAWGAAMSQALDFLREMGLARGNYTGVYITQKGKEFLRKLDKDIENGK